MYSAVRALVLMVVSVMLSGGSPAAAARYESAFTALAVAQCRAMEDVAAAAGTHLWECSGRDGIRVILAADERRSWLRLRVARDVTDLMLAMVVGFVPDALPRVAATRLEWRYRVAGTQRSLVALILHVAGSTDQPGRSLPAHRLVLRVTPDVTFCVINTARSDAGARRLAEGPIDCAWIIPPVETS